MKLKFNIASGVFRFYYDGFRNMSNWGKKVWLIILIKLFIIFVLLRIFFFPDFLRKNFENDSERSNYVLDNLTTTNLTDD
jgi:hypothetical protein